VLKSGNGWQRAADDLDGHVGRLAALAAYDAAGTEPADIDVAEVHDATAIAEIVQCENLALVPRGGGGFAAQNGETAHGGRVPVNVSGGLVAKGHPIGATGLAQVFELVRQLRGEADLQVENARVAVAENGGGFRGVEEAVCAVTVLVR
jgi:acetyl-CoA acetyltransferase